MGFIILCTKYRTTSKKYYAYRTGARRALTERYCTNDGSSPVRPYRSLTTCANGQTLSALSSARIVCDTIQDSPVLARALISFLMSGLRPFFVAPNYRGMWVYERALMIIHLFFKICNHFIDLFVCLLLLLFFFFLIAIEWNKISVCLWNENFCRSY